MSLNAYSSPADLFGDDEGNLGRLDAGSTFGDATSANKVSLLSSLKLSSESDSAAVWSKPAAFSQSASLSATQGAEPSTNAPNAYADPSELGVSSGSFASAAAPTLDSSNAYASPDDFIGGAAASPYSAPD